jgi:hypothetical protein
MADTELLKRLATDLVDGRSMRPNGGAPWDVLAGELEHLHRGGHNLTDLATAVRSDLSPDE